MVNFEFLRTINGALTVAQVIFGFAAIFASSFIWTSGNLFFQFIFAGYGWQTLILFIYAVTFLFSLIVFLGFVFEKDISGILGKLKVLIAYGIGAVGLLAAASLESWYASIITGYLKTRFIISCVMAWILFILYVAQLIIIWFFV